MTDIMKLAQEYAVRYRVNRAVDEARAALQSAIEALQGENERLAKELDAAQEEINCAESALEAFSCEFEAEVFNQGFDCLGDFVQALWKASNGQRDALQAKLDELQRQEPVAHQFQTEIDKKWHNFIDDEHYHHTVDDGRWPIRALYAAPKALAPEQVEAAWRAGWAACRDAEYVGQEAEDEAFGMSQTCANADWESAAPKALEPLTQTQVMEAFCNTPHNVQYVSVFDAGVRFAEKHHGITKGTP